ncbi:hypothetical protein U1Q18_052128 [Sarracenia purpurea var. burkii]
MPLRACVACLTATHLAQSLKSGKYCLISLCRRDSSSSTALLTGFVDRIGSTIAHLRPIFPSIDYSTKKTSRGSCTNVTVDAHTPNSDNSADDKVTNTYHIWAL